MDLDAIQFKDGSQKCMDYIEKMTINVHFFLHNLHISVLIQCGCFKKDGICFGSQQQCYKEVVVIYCSLKYI